jgi:molybdopterin-guanine dinucleotide biosynthesis protein A
VVLAGGANTRFGGMPKGLAVVDDQRVVDRVLEALRPVSDELLLITNDPAIRECVSSVAARPDVRGERSSLIGLHSALTYCREAALVVAWDMPFVPAALLARLREVGQARDVAVIPAGPYGPEPLCAYYPKRALPVIERQLDRAERRLAAFINELPACVILSPDEVAAFGPPARLFANINSAADLAAVQQLERGDERAANPLLGTSAEHR